MNLKKTLFLGAILAGIFFYMYRVELPEEAAKERADLLLAGWLKSDLDSVSITRGADTYVLKRASTKAKAEPNDTEIEVISDADWHIEGKPESQIDPGALNTLISGLFDLKLESQIPEADVESDHAVYGLDQPPLQVSVGSARNEVQLNFGKLNDYVRSRYLLTSTRPGIFLVSENVFNAANKSAFDFQKKNPIEFQDADLKSVTIVSAGEETVLTRESTGDWSITKPEATQASPEKMGELLRSIRSLKAVEIIDTPEDLDAYGITKPAAEVTFNFNNADRTPLVAKFGQVAGPVEGDAPPTSYLGLSSKKTVYQLAENPAPKVFKSFAELRERQLFKFAPYEASEVQLSGEGIEPVTIKRVEEGWMVNDEPGDEVFVEELLESLANVTAVDFAKAEQDFGFNQPKLKAAVKLIATGPEKAETERTLVVGQAVVQGSTPEARFYATVSGQNLPFMISDATLKAITPKLEGMLKR